MASVSKQPTVIGTFERVSFPDLGIINIVAKVDTGAYSGSLHCTRIKVKINEAGKKILQFSPFDHPEKIKMVEKFRTDTVTSSNGSSELRYFIYTKVTIGGETYPIRISLANRSSMRWPVLIGRRFLRRNNLLVDASRNKP